MGCASSTEAKAEQKAEPRSPAGVEKPPKETKEERETKEEKAKAKAKLLDQELVSLAAPGLVHEQYTFDQGGTLGASLCRPIPEGGPVSLAWGSTCRILRPVTQHFTDVLLGISCMD